MGKARALSEVDLDEAVFARVSPHAAEFLWGEPDFTETTRPIHERAVQKCRALFAKNGKEPTPDAFDIAYQRHFAKLASKPNGKMHSAI